MEHVFLNEVKLFPSFFKTLLQVKRRDLHLNTNIGNSAANALI